MGYVSLANASEGALYLSNNIANLRSISDGGSVYSSQGSLRIDVGRVVPTGEDVAGPNTSENVYRRVA